MSALTRFHRARYERYRALLDWRRRVPELLEAVEAVLPGAKAYIFGSALRDELTANSDVDVLIVSKGPLGRQRHGIAAAMEERLSSPSIFELHLATEEEADWYRRHAGGSHPRSNMSYRITGFQNFQAHWFASY